MALVERSASHSGYGEELAARKGFFTDTSICIGCKACEVACKEWNRNPADGDYSLLGSSFDNTGSLGADTWRHVAFVEQSKERIDAARAEGRALISLGMPGMRPESDAGPESLDQAGTPPDTPQFRWLMASDVCKHCTHAGCLDVCPTGALFRTEHGTVVVQDDVCNGCGTCVAGCPFGVIERRSDGGVRKRDEHEHTVGGVSSEEFDEASRSAEFLDAAKEALTALGKQFFGYPEERRPDFTVGSEPPVRNIGVAQKCTLCYDRLKDGQVPACAKACPTQSIQFGTREELLEIARRRVAELHRQGMTEARLYGANDEDGVGGTGSIFLLLDAPEVYGLPPDPEVPTVNLMGMVKRAAVAALAMYGATTAAFVWGGRN